MPLSREEKLRRKREAEKRRYERLKQDPEGREKLKMKERDQYLKKREKGVVKPIGELSERDKRIKRRQWRHNSKTYSIKNKTIQMENQFLEQNTPPSSPVLLQNVIDLGRDTPQSISGKRLAARNRKTRSRRSKTKEEAIEKLRKRVAKYKVKYHRLKKKIRESKRVKITFPQNQSKQYYVRE